MKESKWEVIRVNGITVAQGYKCPICSLIQPRIVCPHCDRERKENDLYEGKD
ncbi:MAG TPA: hypothetical protein VMX17_04905 [Candidatus Glassbacteria bacterium]|nr:hypothetical protein [Candidatus Glassbacteria bacterium]